MVCDRAGTYGVFVYMVAVKFEVLALGAQERLDREDRVRGDFLDGQPDAVDARLPEREERVVSFEIWHAG